MDELFVNGEPFKEAPENMEVSEVVENTEESEVPEVSEEVSETPETPETPEKPVEAESNPTEDNTDTEDTEEPEETRKKPNSYKRRIDKLHNVIREKDEKINKLIEALGSTTLPIAADYTDPQEYIDAVTDYKVANQFKQMEQKKLEIERQNLEKLKTERFQEDFKQQVKTNPELIEIIQKGFIEPAGLSEVVLESEIGAELFAYVLKNQDFAEELAELERVNPKAAQKKLYKLEMQLENNKTTQQSKSKPEKVEKVAPVSKAPEPAKPLKGSAPKVIENGSMIFF